MTESSVPVDIDNMGQVLACVGLMECEQASVGAAAGGSHDLGERSERALGRFDVEARGRATSGRFALVSPAGREIGSLLDDLREARVVALRPFGTDLADKETETADYVPGERIFPSAPPSTASALPVEIVTPNWRVRIGSWTEQPGASGRDRVKFWAGNTTGAKLGNLAVSLVRDADGNEHALSDDEPFSFAAPQSSSFRLDRRRDYIPLDAGFSANQNKDVKMVGYPLVELLAAIGLEHARPRRHERLRYTYAVPRGSLPLTMLRAAVGDVGIGVPCRRFEALLGFPGDEKQRCIIDTREIT